MVERLSEPAHLQDLVRLSYLISPIVIDGSTQDTRRSYEEVSNAASATALDATLIDYGRHETSPTDAVHGQKNVKSPGLHTTIPPGAGFISGDRAASYTR